jgi:hypothetical protein
VQGVDSLHPHPLLIPKLSESTLIASDDLLPRPPQSRLHIFESTSRITSLLGSAVGQLQIWLDLVFNCLIQASPAIPQHQSFTKDAVRDTSQPEHRMDLPPSTIKL